MADEVVDIRKRIEEMRNEVSAAIVSHQELEDATYSVDQNADMLGRSSSDPMILLHESKRNSLFMGSLLIQILMKRPPSTCSSWPDAKNSLSLKCQLPQQHFIIGPPDVIE